MRCYDCLQEARSDTIDIGVCSRCGLAACENHARVRQVQVTRQIGMGAAYGRIPARRVSATPETWPRPRTDPHGALVAPHHRSPNARCPSGRPVLGLPGCRPAHWYGVRASVAATVGAPCWRRDRGRQSIHDVLASGRPGTVMGPAFLPARECP
ncbi:DUF2180 family protein [Streptomyces coeruleorubidus]|uniref:DUF2180 family protein n=1 Tax=Streptomyces coeruleorubidus TaxID=116188 RepID=UPI003CD0042C